SISFSSFIINKADLEEFKKWAYVELLTVSGDRKLENRFLSEYYWHPDQKIDLNTNRFETKFLCKETSYNYQFKYSEYNYSYYDPENSLKSSLLVPPVWMIDQFKLKMKNGYSPLWFDDTNELFFYDPSYYDPGIAAALINKKELEKYLSKSKYILVWYVFFQKNIKDEKKHKNLGEINYHGIYSTENGIITGNYKERDRFIISE
ncbi:MAG: hypothetical protein JXJ04_18670, partial [Spirochaetales bacterium]|nr:hypothetical protein [Spirochaetales bacterium]